MVTIDRLLTLIILIWAFIYTISYGTWTWKSKNRLGAVMVYLLALAVVILPIYTIFFRSQ